MILTYNIRSLNNKFSLTQGPHMEEPLYHYTSQEGLLGIIGSKVIWASNIHYLNDSKEFIHAIDEVKAMIWQRKRDESNEVLSRLYENIGDRLEGISRLHIFVVSLTERGDQLSQWRGYCTNGAGYSIGFSKSVIETLSKRQGFTFRPCIYDWQQQRQLLDEPLRRAVDVVASASDLPEIMDRAVNQFLTEFVQIAPLLKHRAFSEEQEWRLVSGPITNTDSRWKTRTGRSTIIPYIEFSLVGGDGDVPVRNVVVGPGPGQELAANALPSFLMQNGVEKWSVAFSQVPYRTT